MDLLGLVEDPESGSVIPTSTEPMEPISTKSADAASTPVVEQQIPSNTYTFYDPEAAEDEVESADIVDKPVHLNPSLHELVSACDFEAMEKLINQLPNLDERNDNNLTALQVLCVSTIPDKIEASLKCLKLLLDNGANIQVLDSKLNSLLHLCVLSGNEQLLELLLKYDKAMIDIGQLNSEGDNALQLSAKTGQLKCMQCLVLNGKPLALVSTPQPQPVPIAVATPQTQVQPTVTPPIEPLISPRLTNKPSKGNIKSLVVQAEAPLTTDSTTFNEVSPFPHLQPAGGFTFRSPKSPDNSLTMSIDHILSRSDSYDGGATSSEIAIMLNVDDRTGSLNSGPFSGGDSVSSSDKTQPSKEQKRLKLKASLKDKSKVASTSSSGAAWMQYEHIRDQGMLEDDTTNTIEGGGGVEFIKQQYEKNQNITKMMRSNLAASVFNAGSLDKSTNAVNEDTNLEKTTSELFPEYTAPPSEWIECYTAANEIYYYNTKTEVVQWENPYEVVTAPAIPSEVAEDPESGAYTDELNETQTSFALDTSLQYSTNTEYPEDYNILQDNGTELFAGFDQPIESMGESYQASNDVVEWMECYTEEGDLYYYNNYTQVTQWENPYETAAPLSQETPSSYAGSYSNFDNNQNAYQSASQHNYNSTTPTVGADTFFASGVAVSDSQPYNEDYYRSTAPPPTDFYPASQVFATEPTTAGVSTTPPLPITKVRKGMATRTISVESVTARSTPSPNVDPVVIPTTPEFTSPPPKSTPPLTVNPYFLQDPSILQSIPSPMYGLDSPALHDYHDSNEKPITPPFAPGTPNLHRGISIDKSGLRQRLSSSHSVSSNISMSSLSDASVDADDSVSGIAGLVSPDDSRLRRAPRIEPNIASIGSPTANNEVDEGGSVDDNTSNASNNTERHLEIWSRFFENAFSAGNKRESSRPKKSKSSRRKDRATAIVDASGGAIDKNVNKSVNKWPSPLSDKRYRALITLALSKSGQTDEGGEDVDTTGIDVSIMGVALLAAVTQNDISTVEELLQAGANPNCVDDQVRSPAHYAAKSGSVEMMALLYDQGGEMEMCDMVGRTPLHICGIFGSESVSDFLLSCAVVCDAVDHSGNTALHLSARGGHVSIVNLLLKFGASAKIRNTAGMTALEIAQTMQPQTPELEAIVGALSHKVSPRGDSKHRNHSFREKEKVPTDTSAPPSAATNKANAMAASAKLSKVQSILKSDDKKVNPEEDRASRRMNQLKQQARDKLQLKEAPNLVGKGPVIQKKISVPNVNNISDDSDEEVKPAFKPAAPSNSNSNTVPPSQLQSQHYPQQASAPVQITAPTAPPQSEALPSGAVFEKGKYTKFADDSASDPSSDEDESNGNGSNLLASSVWGVATTLIDISLSMFGSSGSNNNSAKNVEPSKNKSSKTSPPAAAVKSSSRGRGGGWFSTKKSKEEEEEQAAIERLIGGSGQPVVAPPTDTELFNKGMGFHAIPSDIVARDLALKAGQMKSGTSGPAIAPKEVQVAVAMARAESLRISPTPFDNSALQLSSTMSTTSLDDNMSVGTPTAIGSPPNGYSIGASLPKGVSWRYVDVLNQK